MQCLWLLPRHDALLISSDSEVVDCLLEDGHCGEHLSRLSDDRYILWHPDEECTDCYEAGEEYCDCFIWWEISEEQMRQLLLKKPGGQD
jgi:hypothetical protein